MNQTPERGFFNAAIDANKSLINVHLRQSVIGFDLRYYVTPLRFWPSLINSVSHAAFNAVVKRPKHQNRSGHGEQERKKHVLMELHFELRKIHFFPFFVDESRAGRYLRPRLYGVATKPMITLSRPFG